MPQHPHGAPRAFRVEARLRDREALATLARYLRDEGVTLLLSDDRILVGDTVFLELTLPGQPPCRPRIECAVVVPNRTSTAPSQS
jgi:hypothetical protein